jgi:hypothetical protein
MRSRSRGPSARAQGIKNLKLSCRLGHPIWGSHKKMTVVAEQELREFVRLKHHSREFRNQQLSYFLLFRDQGVGDSNPLSPAIIFKEGHVHVLELFTNRPGCFDSIRTFKPL